MIPQNPQNPDLFRQNLVDSQQLTPALRDAYQQQLDAILYEPRSTKNRALAITLLLICLAVVAAEIRALIIYSGPPFFYAAAATMLLACSAAAAWIIRDLFRPKVQRQSAFRIADLFFAASWILVVVQALRGLAASSNPASTFDLLYVLTFAGVCTAWSLASRITAAELAARENSLRLELRLATLAERLPRT
ncbi:MAG TPA: hypothetical protein VH253_02510 [Phycisphaerae bacterium]|nr:hypothetical protein [Phycisphaerae bacterium]